MKNIDILNVEYILSTMGPALREEVFKNASEHDHHAFYHRPLRERNANYDYSVDFSNGRYTFGSLFVYCWFDSYGRLFYIGQGTGDRAATIDDCRRSSSFLKRCHGDIYLFVLAGCVNKHTALSIERMLIQTACSRFENIVNVKEMLTPHEAHVFANINAGFIDTDDDEEIMEKWHDYKNEVFVYEEVYNNFVSLLENGIGNATPFKKPNRNPDRKKYWTIDGVTKSRYAWCKEHDITVSAVERRLKHGLSLKQALSLPKLKAGNGRPSSIEQWRDMGLLDKAE